MDEKNLISFDSRGHLTQIDYAKRCVSSSNTIISMNTINCSVVFLNSFSSRLGNFIDTNIFIINKFICISGTGMFSDLKLIIKRARKDAMSFYYNFGEKITVSLLTKKISFFIQEYTQKSGVRPFGVGINVIGSDENGISLYKISPGGAYSKNHFCAMGENSNECLQFLKSRWNYNYNLGNCFDIGIRCLKENSNIKLVSENVQIAYITKNREIKILGKKNIENVIKKSEIYRRIDR
jgi:20S proteasome subunit alpha 2